MSVMVEEVFEDVWDDTGALRFVGWRCVNCGEILDPVILVNRATRPSPFVDRARKRHTTVVG